jgi:hypothetical protein
LKQILVDARLAGRSSVRLEPFDPTKTAEQLVVR